MFLFERSFPILKKISPKLKLFVEGRKKTFSILTDEDLKTKKNIWFHTASLGEFEQALPIIKEIDRDKYHILVSFFSPSGFDVKKNHPAIDFAFYLPIDTKKNMQKLVAIIQPEISVFIKYEIWPNLLTQLKKQNSKIYLASALFRKNQVYFKSWASFFKKALFKFDYIFTQNQDSIHLLNEIGFSKASVSGDTRFDRVTAQLAMNNTVSEVERFLGHNLCFVIGSSWEEDEAVFVEFINAAPSHLKFVIAPHEIKKNKLDALKDKVKVHTLTYSKFKTYSSEEIKAARVLIIDSIGLLGKIYSYANIAYVGGGMGTSGLHNILEPATFGAPIIIGMNYEKFPEAKMLIELEGVMSINSSETFFKIGKKLTNDKLFREAKGKICKDFIQKNTGATKFITNQIFRAN